MSNNKALLQEFEESMEKIDLMDVLERVNGSDVANFYSCDPVVDNEYRIGTDDDNLSDVDPIADHAAFVAYLHAAEDDNTYMVYPIRRISDCETDRRVTR
jgi:hypothetical protein